MFILVLKLILALVLTMIPFVFHYWIKPKSNESQNGKLDFHFGGEPSVYKKKEKNYFPLVYGFLQEDEIQS